MCFLAKWMPAFGQMICAVREVGIDYLSTFD